MRVLGIVAVLCLIASLPPLASAQAPDPAEAVSLACATLGGAAPQARDLLPVCPQVDPAPAQPAEANAEADAPAPGAGTPQDAADLAGEIVEDASAIPDDPAGAFDRLLSIVATIVQFVKDVLGLPSAVLAGIGTTMAPAHAATVDAFVTAAKATVDGGAGALDALGNTAAFVVDAVRDLLAPADEVPAPAPRDAPHAARGAVGDAKGLVDEVIHALPAP